MPFLDSLIGNDNVNILCFGLLYIVLFINIKSAFKFNVKGTNYFVLFFTMVIYSTFYCPQNGDNYTSMDAYYRYMNGTSWENLHFEYVYFFLMDSLPHGYVYYRIVVWGMAALLCTWFMYTIKIKSSIATFAILSFALPILLYYQRAAFAYVLLYVALYSFLSKGYLFENVFFLRYLALRLNVSFSLGLLFLALLFHTTMPVYIIILIISFIIPKNKLGIVLLCFALLIFSISITTNSISLIEFLGEDTIKTGMRSLDHIEVEQGKNAMGNFYNFIRWLPLRCMLVYCLYMMINNKIYMTHFEKICLLNTFLLISISIMFVYYNTTIMVKFNRAAMMPWTFFIASYYNRNVGSFICSIYSNATILILFMEFFGYIKHF